jgi:hypothetical protein
LPRRIETVDGITTECGGPDLTSAGLFGNSEVTVFIQHYSSTVSWSQH